MRKRCLPVLLLLLPAWGLWGQRCISQDRLAQYIHEHPGAQAVRTELERFTGQWTGETPLAVQPRTAVTIPVVFHVVWRLPEENISDEQIQSQLAALNQDFRLLNNTSGLIPAFFQPLAADLELNFCLAKRTPEGLPTDGIVRVNTILPFIGDRIAGGRKSITHPVGGGSGAWDPARYLNIWVGRRQFFPAEASFPGAAAEGEDGIIIDPSFVGTTGTAADNQPYHLGRTLTHEAGHYFNLYHLWGPGQPGSCAQSDEVADTPVQSKSYLSECPSHPQITCGTADMFMNFMNYTDDACMAMFSHGQKTRVWAAINGFRQGLLDSDGCQPVVSVQEPEAGLYIKIAGNPATDFIHLRTRGMEGKPLAWRLADSRGIECARGSAEAAADMALPVGGLPGGVYVLQIQVQRVRIVEKVIIIR